MSQVLVGEVEAPVSEGFDYKPVPVLAPIALALGLASGFALLAEIGIGICIAGIVVGWLALRTVRKADGAYGGLRIAAIGLTASVFFLISGLATHIYAYATEVPEGHYRVNFSRDISDKKFVTIDGKRKLHEDVERYNGQKIFIKGFMYNTKKSNGLSDFILLKDNGQCCFGGDPKPYDMMHVKLQDGLTVNRIDGLVSVAGVLKCRPQATEGAVYVVEATLVEPARTSH